MGSSANSLELEMGFIEDMCKLTLAIFVCYTSSTLYQCLYLSLSQKKKVSRGEQWAHLQSSRTSQTKLICSIKHLFTLVMIPNHNSTETQIH